MQRLSRNKAKRALRAAACLLTMLTAGMVFSQDAPLGAAAVSDVPPAPQHLWTIGKPGLSKESISLNLGYHFRDINEDGAVDLVIKGYGQSAFDYMPSMAAWDGKTGAMLWIRRPSKYDYIIRAAFNEHLLVSGATPKAMAPSLLFGAIGSAVAQKTPQTHQYAALDWKTGKEKWTVKAKGFILGDKILSFEKSGVAAFDILTGEALWKNNVAIDIPMRAMRRAGRSSSWGMVTYTPMAVTSMHAQRDRLIARSPQSILAVNLATGKKLWEYEAPEKVSIPGSDAERVYFTGDGGTLYAVSIQTGELAWSAELPKAVGLWEEPETLTGLVVVPAVSRRTICAFSSGDGRLLWNHSAAPGEFFRKGYVWLTEIDGVRRMAIYSEGKLTIKDAMTGETLRTHDVTMKVPSGVQEPDGLIETRWGYMLFPSGDRGIGMLDYKTGETLWRADFDELYRRLTLDGKNGVMYSITASRLTAHSLETGKIIGTRNVEGGQSVRFSPEYGALFVQHKDKTLLCLDGTTGKLLWTISLPTKGWVWRIFKDRMFVYHHGQISAYDLSFDLMRQRYKEAETPAPPEEEEAGAEAGEERSSGDSEE